VRRPGLTGGGLRPRRSRCFGPMLTQGPQPATLRTCVATAWRRRLGDHRFLRFHSRSSSCCPASDDPGGSWTALDAATLARRRRRSPGRSSRWSRGHGDESVVPAVRALEAAIGRVRASARALDRGLGGLRGARGALRVRRHGRGSGGAYPFRYTPSTWPTAAPSSDGSSQLATSAWVVTSGRTGSNSERSEESAECLRRRSRRVATP
jgi:hypothetical protein